MSNYAEYLIKKQGNIQDALERSKKPPDFSSQARLLEARSKIESSRSRPEAAYIEGLENPNASWNQPNSGGYGFFQGLTSGIKSSYKEQEANEQQKFSDALGKLEGMVQGIDQKLYQNYQANEAKQDLAPYVLHYLQDVKNKPGVMRDGLVDKMIDVYNEKMGTHYKRVAIDHSNPALITVLNKATGEMDALDMRSEILPTEVAQQQLMQNILPGSSEIESLLKAEDERNIRLKEAQIAEHQINAEKRQRVEQEDQDWKNMAQEFSNSTGYAARPLALESPANQKLHAQRYLDLANSVKQMESLEDDIKGMRKILEKHKGLDKAYSAIWQTHHQQNPEILNKFMSNIGSSEKKAAVEQFNNHATRVYTALLRMQRQQGLPARAFNQFMEQVEKSLAPGVHLTKEANESIFKGLEKDIKKAKDIFTVADEAMQNYLYLPSFTKKNLHEEKPMAQETSQLPEPNSIEELRKLHPELNNYTDEQIAEAIQSG